MSELLVVEGCTLQSTSGSVSITTAACIKLGAIKCGGNEVYNTIVFTVSDPPYSGGGTLVGNSAKIKSNSLSALLANALVQITLYGPGGSTKPATVSVQNAGQTKVKAV